jgi:hypothetical protein
MLAVKVRFISSSPLCLNGVLSGILPVNVLTFGAT